MNDETRQEADAWLVKAHSDLNAARILSDKKTGQLDVAIYHCQQAAEKALKGWLVHCEIAFEKTHDLERLLDLASGHSHSLSNLAEHSRVLTPYAVEFRYPGDVPEPTDEEMATALELAEQVVDSVSKHLK